MNSSWTLQNKKTLITGGTKGIGKATVVEFLSLGAEVLFSARNQKDVESLEKELINQFSNSKIKGIVADVSKKEDQQKIADWIKSNWQELDILVNNAGINIRKPTIEYTQEEYQKIWNINLLAPFQISKLLYLFLKKAQESSIINVASVAGSFDVGTGSPYGISKGGMIQMSRNLAVEWAKDGIRVNTVSPWFTVTPLTESVLTKGEKMKAILNRTPLGRVAEAEEMASVIAFLAMKKASYITAQNINVDGGMSAKGL